MVTVELVFEKPTKRTVRYRHDDFGVIYVPNDVVAQLGSPESIRMTLEALGEAQDLSRAAWSGSVTFELVFEKPTKGTVRYRHDDFGTIYVPNDVVAQLGSPESIRMTLEPAAARVELAQAA